MVGRLASLGASALAAAVVLLASADRVAAQDDPCLSLKGSTQCPSFQDAYINPTNLSSAWPWFSQVSDVASFDDQFSQYFTDPTRFIATKLNNQLQCNRTGSDNTTLQWERTILCGQFSQISYSAQCNVAKSANPIMVCQETCVEYSNSENTIVANPEICTPTDSLTDAHNQTRSATLLKDYVTCTDWTSLVSTNNATCVSGASNEGNCGYGPGVSTQLCEVCDPSGNKTVPACCYDRQTDLGQCSSYGHPGAAAVLATTSVATGFQTATGASSTSNAQATGTNASSLAGQNNGGGGGANLSGGQLAGIIVGCIAGAALIGALLAWCLFGRKRRRNDQDHEASRGLVYGAGGAGAAGAAASREKNSGGWNNSDADTSRSMGGISPAENKSPQSMDTGALPASGGGGGGHGGHGAAVGGAALAGAGAAGAAGAVAAGSGSHNNNNNNERPQSGFSTGTAGSGTDGRGTTVPLVKDQYTGQDIYPGEEVVAIYPYNASLTDELTLEPEQRLTVLRLYDDGWALGKTLDGREGALPLVCVSSAKGDAPARLRAGSGRDTTTGTSDDEGLTSGNEGGFTSSVDGAVTADEGGFTSDGGRSRTSRR